MFYIYSLAESHCATPSSGIKTTAVPFSDAVPGGHEIVHEISPGMHRTTAADDFMDTVCEAQTSFSIDTLAWQGQSS